MSSLPFSDPLTKPSKLAKFWHITKLSMKIDAIANFDEIPSNLACISQILLKICFTGSLA